LGSVPDGRIETLCFKGVKDRTAFDKEVWGEPPSTAQADVVKAGRVLFRSRKGGDQQEKKDSELE